MPTWEQYYLWLEDALVQKSASVAKIPQPSAFVTDSREIRADEWFVPLRGESFDGHQFIEQAMQKGALGFFYEIGAKPTIPESLLAKGVGVSDTLLAFQKLATGWRRTLRKLKLIALTGSSGKTTTKEILSSILQAAGPTYSTFGSFNNEIGVPKTLLQLNPEHRYAAVEFGARNPHDIRFLCKIAEPDIAALLNVGKAHLGIFGSEEALLNTKLEIFRDSPRDALVVANHDDPRILDAAIATGKQVFSFGIHAEASVRVLSSEWHGEAGSMTITLDVAGKRFSAKLKTAHEKLPINAAAACAMSLAAGIDQEVMRKGLAAFGGVKGRYLVHRLPQLTLIDDSYNANPDSMAAGFATLAHSYGERKKVLILGDMLELGDASAEEHQKIGALCTAVTNPALLITVGKDGRHIAAGAQEAGLNEDRIRSFDAVDDLIAAAIPLSQFGEIAYVKASNGVKLSKFVEALTKKSD